MHAVFLIERTRRPRPYRRIDIALCRSCADISASKARTMRRNRQLCFSSLLDIAPRRRW
jgi:hypothetical protein